MIRQRERRRRLLYLLLVTSLCFSVNSVSIGQTPKRGEERAMKEIRAPAVAGMFYPDRPEILSRDVRGYLENAKKERIEGEVIALVSPHA